MQLDWQALALSLLNTVLTFGGGTLALAAAGWIADTVARLIPPLRPFRDLVRQWILAQLDRLKDVRAQNVAIGAEQRMNAQLKSIPSPTPDQLATLKAQRNAEAIAQAINNRIESSTGGAADRMERAVGQLKADGKL